MKGSEPQTQQTGVLGHQGNRIASTMLIVYCCWFMHAVAVKCNAVQRCAVSLGHFGAYVREKPVSSAAAVPCCYVARYITLR
jgi:hypothetical protein